MFLGGYIGSARSGVNAVRGLALKFSHVIIDLNTHFAVTGADMSDFVFDGCWIYCKTKDNRTVIETNLHRQSQKAPRKPFPWSPQFLIKVLPIINFLPFKPT